VAIRELVTTPRNAVHRPDLMRSHRLSRELAVQHLFQAHPPKRLPSRVFAHRGYIGQSPGLWGVVQNQSKRRAGQSPLNQNGPFAQRSTARWIRHRRPAVITCKTGMVSGTGLQHGAPVRVPWSREQVGKSRSSCSVRAL